ncbi:hypothetical protein AALF85_05270 [Jeotgalicoccus halotolerans]|uniref:hypothetical protein n=1 Tax=Jeotgalicoccus halotolerans TaxID=157227 RepID=UPI0035173485
MKILELTDYIITLDFSKIKEIELINLHLKGLISFNHIKSFVIGDMQFLQAKIISEYSLDELLKIYEEVM